jgi:hypothetical protein
LERFLNTLGASFQLSSKIKTYYTKKSCNDGIENRKEIMEQLSLSTFLGLMKPFNLVKYVYVNMLMKVDMEDVSFDQRFFFNYLFVD